jgi:hypothetical protein
MAHTCRRERHLVELPNGDVCNADVCTECGDVNVSDKIMSVAGFSLTIEGKELECRQVGQVELECRQVGQVEPELYRIEL